MAEQMKTPYEPSAEKFYDIAPDERSRERIRVLREVYREISAMLPGMVGLTVFGSLAKGKPLTDTEVAQRADVDFMAYLDANAAKAMEYRALFEHEDLRVPFIQKTVTDVRQVFEDVRRSMVFSNAWPNDDVPELDIPFLNRTNATLSPLDLLNVRRKQSCSYLETFARPMRESLDRKTNSALDTCTARATTDALAYDAYVRLLREVVDEIAGYCTQTLRAIADELHQRVRDDLGSHREADRWLADRIERVRAEFQKCATPSFDRVSFLDDVVFDRIVRALASTTERTGMDREQEDIGWHVTTPLSRGTAFHHITNHDEVNPTEIRVRSAAFFGIDVGGGMRKFRQWFFDRFEEMSRADQERMWCVIMEDVFRSRYRNASDPDRARAAFRSQFPQTPEAARRKFCGKRADKPNESTAPESV